jgi:hypothetical protein
MWLMLSNCHLRLRHLLLLFAHSCLSSFANSVRRRRMGAAGAAHVADAQRLPPAPAPSQVLHTVVPAPVDRRVRHGSGWPLCARAGAHVEQQRGEARLAGNIFSRALTMILFIFIFILFFEIIIDCFQLYRMKS